MQSSTELARCAFRPLSSNHMLYSELTRLWKAVLIPRHTPPNYRYAIGRPTRATAHIPSSPRFSIIPATNTHQKVTSTLKFPTRIFQKLRHHAKKGAAHNPPPPQSRTGSKTTSGSLSQSSFQVLPFDRFRRCSKKGISPIPPPSISTTG